MSIKNSIKWSSYLSNKIESVPKPDQVFPILDNKLPKSGPKNRSKLQNCKIAKLQKNMLKIGPKSGPKSVRSGLKSSDLGQRVLQNLANSSRHWTITRQKVDQTIGPNCKIAKLQNCKIAKKYAQKWIQKWTQKFKIGPNSGP
jgi:hypothetical protein